MNAECEKECVSLRGLNVELLTKLKVAREEVEENKETVACAEEILGKLQMRGSILAASNAKLTAKIAEQQLLNEEERGEREANIVKQMLEISKQIDLLKLVNAKQEIVNTTQSGAIEELKVVNASQSGAIEELKVVNASQSSAIEELKVVNASQSGVIEELKVEIEELKVEIEELKVVNASQSGVIEELNVMNAKQEIVNASQSGAIGELEVEIEELKVVNASQSGAIEELNVKIEGLEVVNGLWKIAIDELRGVTATLEVRLGERENDIL
jgi:uncharacterized coiled-coil protein SlyX